MIAPLPHRLRKKLAKGLPEEPGALPLIPVLGTVAIAVFFLGMWLGWWRP